jgi:aldose 1-epimerase
VIEDFGQMPDGTAVQRLRLNGGGLTAHVLTYGTVLQDLRLEGHEAPLVLGFPEFASYLEHSRYFGATAGRCANRIRDGHLELDGQTYQLDRNFLGRHSLHGGAVSMGKQLWTLEDHAMDWAVFSIVQEDGHMGYPGRLEAKVTYALLPGGVFDVQMEATTDAPTLCNMAHHSYWCLDTGGSIADHMLQVEAEHYLPVDEGLIPTGEEATVAGTGFDFREPAPVSQQSGLFDHNFCLSRQREGIRPVARLHSPASGVRLEVRTTEPGLQVYDGAKLDIPVPGLDGQSLGAHAGIAIEPQIWPDAPHNPDFPQAVLRPGETYRQHSQFKISKD